jgi:CDP-diacylglycerol---glycerol-3-phosphate 3-phosphatidyltransferase
MKLTIPTMLTLIRIVLIPVLVLVFYWNHPWANIFACAVFAAGAITDWLDGWIARKYNMFSKFGAFLDPVADKLAVTVALFLIVQYHHTVWMALIAAVIVGREITISALREWMAELGARAAVKVGVWGKIKTIVQMVAISFLLFRENLFGLPIFLIGEWLLAFAAILTLWPNTWWRHGRRCEKVDAMSSRDEFVAFLIEQMAGLGKVTTKKMFGGYGFYFDGLIFAVLIEDDQPCLKADAESEKYFVSAGSREKTYEGKNKPIRMSYWTLPEAALEEADQMTYWAKLAYAAALRKANAKPVGKKSAQKTAKRSYDMKFAAKKSPAKQTITQKPANKKAKT